MNAVAVMTRRRDGAAAATTRGTGATGRWLASASLGASAVGLGLVARHEGWDPAGIGLVVLLGVAAVGFSRRSILAQVLSRAVAYVFLTPMLFGVAEALAYGRLPDSLHLFFAGTTAGALALARPSLHTAQAKAEFSPVAYRRLFLAGAVASATAGILMGLFGVEIGWTHPHGLGLAALAAALIASSVGVVRMRAWGVLLALVTSVGALGTAALAHDQFLFVRTALALSAIPGALLGLPLLLARLRGPAPVLVPKRARLPGQPETLAYEGENATPPVLTRIAGVPEMVAEDLAHPVRLAVSEK